MSRINNNDTFFQDGAADRPVPEMTYIYHFDTLPEMRKLLSERLQGAMTDEEIFEAVKTAFRNKPKTDSAENTSGDIVDYIYQM